jgi:hypothetical protein
VIRRMNRGPGDPRANRRRSRTREESLTTYPYPFPHEPSTADLQEIVEGLSTVDIGSPAG